MAYVEKYVTHDSTGGDGSISSPWTLAQAFTDATASDRVNIKSSGTYTLTADLTVTNPGTIANPIYWRGYQTTIGDLESVRRVGTQPLVTTGFPLINGNSTYRLIFSDFNIIENLEVITATSAATITTGQYCSVVRVKSTNTETTINSVGSLSVGTYSASIMCDCYSSTPYSNSSVLTGNRSRHCGDRLEGAGTTQRGYQSQGFSSVHQMIVMNCVDGIRISSLGESISNCTIVNCTNGININNTVLEYCTNNLIYGMSGYGILGGSTNGVSTGHLTNNIFGACTSGSLGNPGHGSLIDSVEGIADPFTNYATKDLTINTASANANNILTGGMYGSYVGAFNPAPVESSGVARYKSKLSRFNKV